MVSSNISNVTGCIQTKKGRANYYIVLSSYDDNGNRVRKWVYTDISVKGDNRRKAKARLQEILEEYSIDCVDISKDSYFSSFLLQWLETLRPSISPTTYDAYMMAIKTHVLPYFEKKRLRVKGVTPAVIQKYVNDKLKDLSPNTVRKHLANLSKCLDSAVKQNIIAYNPVKRIEMPKKVKYTGAKSYNEKQIEQLLEYSKGDPLEILIRLTLFYGLRRSEVLGLMWGAVDFIDNTITIKHTVVPGKKTLHKKDATKNDSSNATLPMPDIIKERLLKWREHQEENKRLQPNDYADTDYICTGVSGELLSPDFVSAHFRLLLKKIGMPHIRFHDLRHSAACYLFSLGYNLKDIQAWLRHKDIQTTANMYLKHDMSARREIADSINERLRIAAR